MLDGHQHDDTLVLPRQADIALTAGPSRKVVHLGAGMWRRSNSHKDSVVDTKHYRLCQRHLGCPDRHCEAEPPPNLETGRTWQRG